MTFNNTVIFIIGVSGSGKSTIGHALSLKTGHPYYDADDFHPPSNVAKMKAGIALTDEDREPWLLTINNFVKEQLATRAIIFVCSALKEQYRNKLSKGIEINCRWVYLSGDYSTIMERLNKREGHYMPPALLQSQFDALEVPAGAIITDIRHSPQEIVNKIVVKLAAPSIE